MPIPSTFSYLGVGVQASAASSYVENFNTASRDSAGNYSTTFKGSGITGTYSGNYGIVDAGQYGGANGAGRYLTTGNVQRDGASRSHLC